MQIWSVVNPICHSCLDVGHVFFHIIGNRLNHDQLTFPKYSEDPQD
jgi:hypothetical protein